MPDFLSVNDDEFPYLYGLALFEAPMHQKGMLALLNLHGQLEKNGSMLFVVGNRISFFRKGSKSY